MAVEINSIAQTKRILAIKFSSIGDIVLTTSPIKTLNLIYPSAKIDILTLKNFAPILEGNQYIDQIISFDRQAGFLDLIKTGRLINNSEYDLVIDFHNSLRSKIIRSMIRDILVKYLRKPYLKRFLLFRLRRNYFQSNFSQLQLLHQPIANLMKNDNYPMPKFFVSEEEIRQTAKYFQINKLNEPYIVIVPGAAWIQKTWSAQKYSELIEIINKHNKNRFIILGSYKDDICRKIADYDSTIINLQGETSLREAMAIMANANFVIGADTGLIHIAEAVGKKTVMILGPTSRETGAGVNSENSITIENNEIWCRPCSQNGKRNCYRNEQFCLTSITPESVSTKIFESGLL